MSYRSDLGKVKGLGSAKHGFGHWWMQRLSAVLLVPTGLFVMICLMRMDELSATMVTAWMKQPLNGIVLLLFLLSASYHAALGIQVVLEDYVHHHGVQLTLQFLVKLTMIVLFMVNIYAVSAAMMG